MVDPVGVSCDLVLDSEKVPAGIETVRLEESLVDGPSVKVISNDSDSLTVKLGCDDVSDAVFSLVNWKVSDKVNEGRVSVAVESAVSDMDPVADA